MKTIKSLLLLFILLPLFITSCDPAEQYKAELATIDSSLVKIDSLEELFDGIEFDSLGIMVMRVKKIEGDLKRLYIPDTLDFEFGNRLNDCKTIRKKLKDTGGYKGTIGDELNAVKHQFMDLRTDILAGLYKDEQIKEYMGLEKAALNTISLTFKSFYMLQTQEKERYYESVPIVEAFVEKLKLENGEME